MKDKKKTVPEQFGQMALGFAQIIRKIDQEKTETPTDRRREKQEIRNK